jgi:hypothetical protein
VTVLPLLAPSQPRHLRYLNVAGERSRDEIVRVGVNYRFGDATFAKY